MTTAEKQKCSVFRWGRHWISLLLCVAFRWLASQFCEQTLDSSSISSSIYCKMLMALSFHTLTWLWVQNCTAYIVIHTVLNRRTSPLTPQAANRWRLKESPEQASQHACATHFQTSQPTVARLLIVFISKAMDTYGYHRTPKSSFANVLLHFVL